jgi:hypothetical protein
MIRILDALEHLEAGGGVEALLDRRPLFLFPELEARALPYTCEPNEYGGYTLVVRRPAEER